MHDISFCLTVDYMSNTSVLSIRISDELKKSLEVQAAKEYRTITSLVISILAAKVRATKKGAK